MEKPNKTKTILFGLQVTPIVVLLIYFVVVFYIGQTNSTEQSRIDFNLIKNSFIETNKKNIKETIEKMKVEIIYEKDKSKEDFKDKLKEKASLLVTSVEDISQTNKLNQEEKTSILKILLNTFVNYEIQNDFYIYDVSNNSFIINDLKYNEFNKDTFYSIKQKTLDEGTFFYKDPSNKIYSINMYSKKLNWIIGTYADYSKYEEKVKQEIITKTNNTFLENYIFIHNHETFEILAHFKKEVIGTKLTKEQTPDRYNNLMQIKNTSTSGGGFLEYKTENNNRPNEWGIKVSYVQSIPEWNWSIGTGFYVDDINIVLKEKEEKVMALNHESIKKFFFTNTLVLIFFIIFLKIFLNDIKNKFNAYQKLQVITKIKLQQALIRKSQKVGLLEETINSYVIKTTVDKNGMITYASNEFCGILGYSKKDIEYRMFTSFNYHYPKNKIDFEEIKSKVSIANAYQGMTCCVLKNKKLIIFETLIYKEEDIYIVLRKNITEKLANEKLIKELESVNDTLESKIKKEVADNTKKDLILNQQAKLASLGELLGMIAHQWRHPLATINANTLSMYKQLLNGQIDTEKLTQVIGNIEKITKDLSYTITNFLNFYQPDLKQKEFKLNCAIEEVKKIVFPEGYNVTVNFISESEQIINGYKSQFQQVILTILVNMLEQFQINRTENPIINIMLEKINKSYILLTIEDNGGGIKKEILDIIFEPYTTTKSDKNTGLGLYIAKKIINQYDWNLSASNTGVGAKFEIEIRI